MRWCADDKGMSQPTSASQDRRPGRAPGPYAAVTAQHAPSVQDVAVIYSLVRVGLLHHTFTLAIPGTDWVDAGEGNRDRRRYTRRGAERAARQEAEAAQWVAQMRGTSKT